MKIHRDELPGLQHLAAQPEGGERIVEGVLYAPWEGLGGEAPLGGACQFALAIVDAELVYAPRVVTGTAIRLHYAKTVQRLARKAEAQPPGGREFRRGRGP